MNYSYRDIYPTMGIEETSTEAIPEPVEQAALQEDSAAAAAVNPRFAGGKKIGLAVVVLACLVVFLGANK